MCLVSVVIPIKNPGAIFKRVFDSVISQNTDFNFDVIIIDSGSTDGTIEFINNYNGIINVKLITIHPSEFGHGKTRNLAVSLSKSKYCALLTHDAVPKNVSWLFNLVKLAEDDPQVAGVFGRHEAYDNATFFTKRELNLHFDGFVGSEIVQLDDKSRYERDLGYKQFLHFFSDNNALIRKSVWEALPYRDVNFSEDQLWAKDIIEAGYKKAYANEAVVYHSHDYSLIERLQRSFDESNAFKRLFGYDIMPSFTTFLKVWFGVTLSEMRAFFNSSEWRNNLIHIFRQPLFNAMKYFGMYIGVHNRFLSRRFIGALSYDKKLYDGLRKGRE
jgi:rhamnosyltransferase